jgi:hypothetical protein
VVGGGVVGGKVVGGGVDGGWNSTGADEATGFVGGKAERTIEVGPGALAPEKGFCLINEMKWRKIQSLKALLFFLSQSGLALAHPLIHWQLVTLILTEKLIALTSLPSHHAGVKKP